MHLTFWIYYTFAHKLSNPTSWFIIYILVYIWVITLLMSDRFNGIISHDPNNLESSQFSQRRRVSCRYYGCIKWISNCGRMWHPTCCFHFWNDKTILQNDCIIPSLSRASGGKMGRTNGGKCVTKAPEMRCLFKSLRIKNSWILFRLTKWTEITAQIYS